MTQTNHANELDANIQIDLSGQGHAWRAIDEDNCPASIRAEIDAEIIDGGREACQDYVASNGLHYRWGHDAS